jgi:hypothetical protein
LTDAAARRTLDPLQLQTEREIDHEHDPVPKTLAVQAGGVQLREDGDTRFLGPTDHFPPVVHKAVSGVPDHEFVTAEAVGLAAQGKRLGKRSRSVFFGCHFCRMA